MFSAIVTRGPSADRVLWRAGLRPMAQNRHRLRESQSTLVSGRDGMMLTVLRRAERWSLAGIVEKRRRHKPMMKTVGINTTSLTNRGARLALQLIVILASVTVWAQAEDATQADAGLPR